MQDCFARRKNVTSHRYGWFDSVGFARGSLVSGRVLLHDMLLSGVASIGGAPAIVWSQRSFQPCIICIACVDCTFRLLEHDTQCTIRT
jgi:hypothetical protein